MSVSRNLNIIISGLSQLVDESNYIEIAASYVNDSRRVVLTGLGKSGIAAKKIAATMISLGIDAVYIHASDALHGDMALIDNNDVLIGISKSGATKELIDIFRRVKCKKLAITTSTNSLLSKISHITLVIPDCEPHDAAPITSTLASIVIGDLLALQISNMRGFNISKFYQTHPGGSIGLGGI